MPTLITLNETHISLHAMVPWTCLIKMSLTNTYFSEKKKKKRAKKVEEVLGWHLRVPVKVTLPEQTSDIYSSEHWHHSIQN